jgi:endonuclease YncB( thermonuclease family)
MTSSNCVNSCVLAAVALLAAASMGGEARAEGTFFKNGRPQSGSAETGAQSARPIAQAPVAQAPAAVAENTTVSVPTSAPPTVPATASQQGAAARVTGTVEQVTATDTLVVAGRTVQLAGVHGTSGPIVDGLRRWLASNGNQLNCTPVGQRYRCLTQGGNDLGPVVLAAGAGQADQDAPPVYRAVESQARAAHRGMWAQR